MFEVQKYILANDVDGAIRLCNGAGNKALPKVIKADFNGLREMKSKFKMLWMPRASR